MNMQNALLIAKPNERQNNGEEKIFASACNFEETDYYVCEHSNYQRSMTYTQSEKIISMNYKTKTKESVTNVMLRTFEHKKSEKK